MKLQVNQYVKYVNNNIQFIHRVIINLYLLDIYLLRLLNKNKL